MFLGYEIKDLKRMYQLHVYETGRKPDDVIKLINFWQEKEIRTPEQVLRTAGKLAEARNKIGEGTEVVDMIHRILQEMEAT